MSSVARRRARRSGADQEVRQHHVHAARSGAARSGVIRGRLVIRASGHLLAGALPSCSLGVDGNGERTEETRDLHDFSSVVADGSLDVQVHQGDTTSVVVSIDSNLQRPDPDPTSPTAA